MREEDSISVAAPWDACMLFNTSIVGQLVSGVIKDCVTLA